MNHLTLKQFSSPLLPSPLPIWFMTYVSNIKVRNLFEYIWVLEKDLIFPIMSAYTIFDIYSEHITCVYPSGLHNFGQLIMQHVLKSFFFKTFYKSFTPLSIIKSNQLFISNMCESVIHLISITKVPFRACDEILFLFCNLSIHGFYCYIPKCAILLMS